MMIYWLTNDSQFSTMLNNQ